MEQPLISVVIPVWNEEKRIARAIQSIQEQTWKNLEIIVVDDHSTDGTAEVVKGIAAQDPRITYHLLPNKPPKRTNWRGYDINAGFAARAYGFTMARGGWITTQDADDASLLNRIETQYNLAQRYNATLVTVFRMCPTPETLGKKLDVEAIFREKGEEGVVITAEETYKAARESLGPLMRLPFHHLIPFPFKWFPYTRKLFYGKFVPYPGADNCMMFRREVIASGINFRHRNKRTFGVPAGRGSGRDFVCQVAYTFKNSWSFKLPLYLWDVGSEDPDYIGYQKYIIS